MSTTDDYRTYEYSHTIILYDPQTNGSVGTITVKTKP